MIDKLINSLISENVDSKLKYHKNKQNDEWPKSKGNKPKSLLDAITSNNGNHSPMFCNIDICTFFGKLIQKWKGRESPDTYNIFRPMTQVTVQRADDYTVLNPSHSVTQREQTHPPFVYVLQNQYLHSMYIQWPFNIHSQCSFKWSFMHTIWCWPIGRCHMSNDNFDWMK